MPTNKDKSAGIDNSHNNITRRTALKTAAAVGATAALASALPTTNAKAANKGGHFKVAWADASSSDSLDTTTYVSEFLAMAGYLWGSPLVSVDSNMNLVPEIAESWETSDAQTWVFKIRKGVEFHDGKTLTPSDVIWSINRHRAEGAASGWQGVGAQIVEMKAGTNEVTFVLAAPNADWPYSLTDYHLKMQHEGVPADSGIGTGAYVNENFEPGVRLSMSRNQNFYKSDGANFDSLEVLGINDPAARVSALQTGQVHFIHAVPQKLANLLEAQFNIIRLPSTVFAQFVMHTQVPPFDNSDMRLALKYAIDREELIDTVFQGAAVLANDHPIPQMFRFAPRDLPQKVYDPEKALYHYKKAGSPAIPELHTSNVAFSGSMEATEMFQAQARKAGVPFDIRRAPDDGYWSNTWHNTPWFASTWYGRATEDHLLSQMLITGSGYNESQWARPHIDKMLAEARSETDDSKRAALYGAILTEQSMDGGHIIPAFMTTLYGCTNDIGGFSASPLGGDCTFMDYLHFTS